MESKPMLLTTIDNPFHPGTQFNEWFAFDIRKGYNTLGYLARVAAYGFDMSPAAESDAIDKAMREIVEINPLGIWTLVPSESDETPVSEQTES